MLVRGVVRRLVRDGVDSKPASAARLRYWSTKCLVADTACGPKELAALRLLATRLSSSSIVKKPSLISLTGRMKRWAAFMGRKPGFAMRHLSSYACNTTCAYRLFGERKESAYGTERKNIGMALQDLYTWAAAHCLYMHTRTHSHVRTLSSHDTIRMAQICNHKQTLHRLTFMILEQTSKPICLVSHTHSSCDTRKHTPALRKAANVGASMRNTYAACFSQYVDKSHAVQGLSNVQFCTAIHAVTRLLKYLDRDVIELTQESHQILHSCVVMLSHCQLQDSIFHIIMRHISPLQIIFASCMQDLDHVMVLSC